MKGFLPEILLLIFNRLHFRQKLECMLVCRAWANVLLEGYLFETIELSVSSTYEEYDSYLRLLMKKAKSQPFIGNKCTRLLLNDNTTGSVDATALASSFPNLKFLNYQYDVTYTPGSRPLSNVTLNSDPFDGWKMSLETLIDGHSNTSVLFDILSTGVFKNLTTLSTVNTYTEDPFSCSKLIAALKNAPALTTLDIIISDFLISQLEELHKNAPNLISLTLEYGSLLKQNDLDRLNIEPAKKLKILKVHQFPTNNYSPSFFLEYIKFKYTCLEEFSYHHCRLYNPAYQFPASDWSEILSTLGSTLTKFTINRDLNSMPFLDLIPQHLNRLESLSLRFDENQKCLNKVLKSGSFYNLRSLSLYDIFITDLKLEVFENFTNLKELDLHFDEYLSHSITLQDVIEKLPKSVETFSVECACIKASERIPSGHSSVVNLKLHFSEYQDERISFFLDQYFPKLKSLVLDTCELRVPFHLPRHHLRYVKYISTGSYRKNDQRLTQLQLTIQDKTLYFNSPLTDRAKSYIEPVRAAGANDYGLQQTLKASYKDETFKYFHLKCANIETVYFGNMLLLF